MCIGVLIEGTNRLIKMKENKIKKENLNSSFFTKGIATI